MTSISFILIIFILLISFECNESHKILITLPGVSGSQSLAMFRLADMLGERGNEVTILLYEIFLDVKKPPLKYAKEISFNMMESREMSLQSNFVNATWYTLAGDELPIRRLTPFFRSFAKGCDKLLQETVLLNELRSKNFDVAVIHYMDFCSFGLVHHLGIEGTVFMSTAYMLDHFAWYSGTPNPFSYAVSGLHDTTDKMNFYHRAKNLALGSIYYVIFQYGISWTYTDLFRKHFGHEFPSLDTLISMTDLYYVNSDPLFEYPRPVMHNIVYIGGFTMQKSEPLSKDWQKIVDESGEHGIVIFSLGSVADTKYMPMELKEAFYFAFKRLPQRVIWRFEGELPEAKGIAKNIYAVDWLPQKDLLAHPNVKAFITHGGYNSLTEATYLGVPLIVFPLFGDQFGNCKRVERLNVGVSLERSNLTQETVYQALQTVLYSQEIQNNARQLGRMIRSKPTSSHDLTVKWIEYLAEFGNLDILKPVSLELNFFQYFLFDIFLSVTIFFVLFLILVMKLCRCCCSSKLKVKRE